MIFGRTAVCSAAAATFSIFILAPTILTLWPRTLPFEYIEISFEQPTVFPGDTIALRFVTGPVHSAASGEFDRIFYDGEGRPQYLGTFPTIYDKMVEPGSIGGAFYKRIRIPPDAKAGDAIYVTKPRFWHNPIQRWLWPISAPVQKAKIRVLAQPDQDRPMEGGDDAVRRPR